MNEHGNKTAELLIQENLTEQFAIDVREGLSGNPKFLQSKYFYDREGDCLFQQIMKLDEYYLTGCEYEILSHHKQDLLDQFSGKCQRFHMIEFGAGDAYKTKVLINHFLEQKTEFEFNPIDISQNAIQKLYTDLINEFPQLQVSPVNMEYFDALEEINLKDSCKKVVLFLGSNIGNFSNEDAADYFSKLGEFLNTGDQLLVGFDLVKNPDVILAAYNDRAGLTREFNLNLLRRINRELDANFDTRAFKHYPTYDPINSKAKSYLISMKKQVVELKGISMQVEFQKSEPVFMEISQKYSLEDIDRFAEQSGFNLLRNYFDNREYFADSLWEKH